MGTIVLLTATLHRRLLYYTIVEVEEYNTTRG